MAKAVRDVRLISLQVGMPKEVAYGMQQIMTGIDKTAVAAPIWLAELNFAGDGQADLVNHGGSDKAVNAYCGEHYSYWEQELGRRLVHGAFGENVTLQNMTEDAVRIGDIYKLGEALVQVSQPRQPCFKLGNKHGVPELPLKVQEIGYTGYYFRVLTPGIVPPQTEIELVERHPAGVTVSFVNRVKYHDKHNRAALEQLLRLEPLAAVWRDSFRRRLEELDSTASNE